MISFGISGSENSELLLTFHDGIVDHNLVENFANLLKINKTSNSKIHIPIKRRSLLSVMYFLSQAVESPSTHIEKGFSRTTLNSDGTTFDWREALGGILRIQSAVKRPNNVFVAINHLNHWFYIPNSDLQTKSTFGLLSLLFSLQSAERPISSPLVTVSAGQ